MERNSAKSAGRAAKSARGSAKKSAKLARPPVKKTAKPAHRAAASPRQVSTPKNTLKPISKSAKLFLKGNSKVIRTSSPPMQPVVSASEIVLKSHKYHVGETVYYTSPSFGRAAASGSYTVVKLLPSEGDDYQYRIKSAGEAFERVAKESQLDRA